MGFISFNKTFACVYYVSGVRLRREEDTALASKSAWSSEGGHHINISIIIHHHNEN